MTTHYYVRACALSLCFAFAACDQEPVTEAGEVRVRDAGPIRDMAGSGDNLPGGDARVGDGPVEPTDPETPEDPEEPEVPTGHWRESLPEAPDFDCEGASTQAPEQRMVENARGYHGLVFGPDGNLIGSDGTSLIRVDSEGERSVWVPALGEVEQMAFLPGGDLIVATAETAGLLRIAPNGQRRPLAPDLAIYGLEIAPDGFIYAAGNDGVWRIDPESGNHEVLIPRAPDMLPHTIRFNRDYTLMVIGVATALNRLDGGEGEGEGEGEIPGDDTWEQQVAACNGLASGAACEFANADGEATPGECFEDDFEAEEGAPAQVVCFSDEGFEASPAQRAACEGLGEEAACQYEGEGGAINGQCWGGFEEGGMECWGDLEDEGGDWGGDNVTDGTSDVLAWAVDKDLNPTGERMTYGANVGGGYHDALAFDICGNLYVADAATTTLFRIAPDRQVEELIRWDSSGEPLQNYGHAFLWGSGADGWPADSLYTALPYVENLVKELNIGIPGQRWTGGGLRGQQ